MKEKFFMFIFNMFLSKEVRKMSREERKKAIAACFAVLIIDGNMTYASVMPWLKEYVKAALISLGRGDLAGVTESEEA